MKQIDIIEYAQIKGDEIVTNTLIEKFEVIKLHPDVTIDGLQFIFTEKKNKLKQLLKEGTEHEYMIALACLLDEVIDYTNLMGESQAAQVLQGVYEKLFTNLISQRMWEIARDQTYSTPPHKA